jgi:NTE family protein
MSAGSVPPKFALVLGSGGVKSIAGLGVAEVLLREGLRPDLIVGSSAGAIFGAVLAMGHSSTEAAALAARLWSREITSQRRWRAWPQLLLPRLSGFTEHFSLRDDRLINARLQQAFGDTRLQDLSTRFAANATDARSGEAVGITQGRLCDALRASIALPFLFAPQALDGRLLVDGSLSDPVPVALAGQARLVVAVGFQVPMPRRLDRASRLATRITATLSNNLMAARLDALAGSHLVSIFPALERRVGLFDTEAMPYLIALGRRSAEAAMPQIEAAAAGNSRLSLAA